MAKEKNQPPHVPDQMNLTADSLRGKQSVRATFRLPPQIIELLSLSASLLGLKQKSLFDQLIEDIEVLSQVAGNAKAYHPVQNKRRQKTFVLSRNSLITLEHVAQKHHIPRDILVEVSIQRLLPVIDAEQKKIQKRKILLKEMEAHLHQGEKILNKAEHLVGEHDEIYGKILDLVESCRKNTSAARESVRKADSETLSA